MSSDVSMNPKNLLTAQLLSAFSFEIPQNPDKLEACYDPNATISTNGKTQILPVFLASMAKSNTLNVMQIFDLSNTYQPTSSPDQIKWTVHVTQKRLGKGLGESGEGIYKIKQVAILTFLNGAIISQVNTLEKTTDEPESK